MKAAVPVLAALALAGCAASPPPQSLAQSTAYSAADASAMTDVVAVEAGSCFRMSQIRNHKKLDDSTLLVEVGSGSIYRWDMNGRCLAGASSSDPLVMSPTSGGDVICRPIDLNLKVRAAGGFTSPCIIKSFVKLTPEQVAALPPKARP